MRGIPPHIQKGDHVMVGLDGPPEGPAGPEDDRVYVDDAVEVMPRKRGRPRKVQKQEQLARVLQLYFVEKLSMRRVAEVMGVSHMSVYRMLSDPNLELLL
ncbi:helix-turn-helix domain-containing protein [Candidatus Micrarchaeota archaeon]|nr:helix-turn-helix domain-containing protein [Candidatus Micrarchaeota archaeon]